MSGSYRTVAGRARATFDVRGSVFTGHVAPIDTVAEAEAFIESVERDHDDATHTVPAYRVPAGEPSERNPTEPVMLREYASDDGEPTGSAGKPALNVLQQRDLSRAVVAIVRYYGGTELGVGGLSRAYARAVTDAIDTAGVVERRPHRRLTVRCVYDDSGTVRGILESEDVDFEANYGTDVTFEARVPVKAGDDLADRLRSATSGRVDIE